MRSDRSWVVAKSEGGSVGVGFGEWEYKVLVWVEWNAKDSPEEVTLVGAVPGAHDGSVPRDS